ncbi:MAG: D-tyrosyl-tRNA(Tyr) deacylase [Clostridia bacterium]|nr:D-tyrosyl-tRNA(Tyr) deacylase [Clostridia bacterium]MBQ1260184.1 D-tyrosyl-tRNA(Tyr) deacylase [Clostridia bacterium]
MIAVVQRVSSATVRVDGKITGECKKGLMILLGVEGGDDEKHADALAVKLSKLRIFKDENDKMNLSVLDVGGSAVVVSNFTLNADYKKGNRPNYLAGAEPARANELYEYFSNALRLCGLHVENGIFGAEMECTIVNDGPVTLVIDSKILVKQK